MCYFSRPYSTSANAISSVMSDTHVPTASNMVSHVVTWFRPNNIVHQHPAHPQRRSRGRTFSHRHIHIPVSQAPTPQGDFLGNLADSDDAVESPNRFDLLGILPRSNHDAPAIYEDWGMIAELMHHYCAVTCNTLTRREDVRHVWRVIIPTEGYANKYVMNGVLAIAAIHRAYLYPAQKDKYTNASAYHLAAGLKEFRELISSPIDRDNWQPVFCFSSMICMHISTATIRLNADRSPSPLSNMIEIFASVKGFQAVMKPISALSSENTTCSHGEFGLDRG